MKLNRFMIASAIALTVLAVGCKKKDAEYDYYKGEVQALYEKIVSTDAIINGIDPTAADSKEELFNSLDKLKTGFSDFAAIDAPEEFDDCETLSAEAVKLITTSEEYFHAALDGEYDEEAFKNGIANYNEVITCVNYMGEVLQQKEDE